MWSESARMTAAPSIAPGIISPPAPTGIRVGEEHFFRDAAGANAAFVPYLGTAEPTGGAPVHGPDEELAADADHPDRHRLPRRAVALERRERQFLGRCYLIEILRRPRGHRVFSAGFIRHLISIGIGRR